MAGKKIILGVTASIAAYKSCDIINAFRRSGHEVRVVMSPDAARFITPLTLQALSGGRVVTDMFEPPDEWEILHTSLGEWADLIVIAPATADMISKLACGRADCVLSALVLASRAKVLIAPAMNDRMYNHKATRENIAKLKSFGCSFIGPARGRLACGYKGVGHISEVKDIVLAARKLLR